MVRASPGALLLYVITYILKEKRYATKSKGELMRILRSFPEIFILNIILTQNREL